MIKASYIKDYGRHGKEEQWVGKPGQRCLECKEGTPQNVAIKGGAVKCNPDNALTWGGALCARFSLAKERVQAVAKGFGK